MAKSSDKPKKQQKQKTLNELCSEKRVVKKVGSRSFIPAVK